MEDIKEQINNVEMVSGELITVARTILQPITQEIDGIISKANNVKDLSNDQIRNLIMLLSLKSYSLGEARDQSAIKSSVGSALKASKYAEQYAVYESGTEKKATQGDKNSYAVKNSEKERLTSDIFDLVSTTLKTKVDEVHRVVDALKSVLMSRMQEAKLTQTLSEIQQGEKI